MAKKQVRTTRIKRSERKNIAVGAAHIKSTFNNTIVSITDPQGNVISWQSAGTVGFKGDVDYTIVNGVPVVQHGELTTIDERETAYEANRVVARYLGR